MASSGSGTPRLARDSWEAMLPGPTSRNNGGSSDCSCSGLLAYGAGSSVAVVDTRSMQLVSVLPLPSPASHHRSLAPFVTSVRWTPQPLRRDILTHEPSSSHLLLAVGDRQGSLSLFDLRHLPPRPPLLSLHLDSSRSGIQDLCWIRSGSASHSWILAAVHGPSLLSLWSLSTSRCFWKYDASPEFLSCLRRDPFDSRRFCALGLRGFLLSLKVVGDGEEDVVAKEVQIPVAAGESAELQRLEREREKENGAGAAGAPSMAAFPNYVVRCCFLPRWRHVVVVAFPKELVVFDLQYEVVLSTAPLPRGCGKFVDVVADPDNEVLYCAHSDGKLSVWRRKGGQQVYTMCMMEELMPSIGTSVPSPTVLSVVICQSESTFQCLAKLYSETSQSTLDAPNCEPFLISKTYLISITDDGKIWNWLLTAEEACLVGQLHLLSSTLTVLAVPSPSLTATLARGGNNPAVAVPLVALGTQSGAIDVIDVSANAVAASFCVHNGIVRGLRWLGNSRLVSFSYAQANEKAGGYNNKLVVTCVRSGLNRIFRVMQKPERAPIRALRASSSGRESEKHAPCILVSMRACFCPKSTSLEKELPQSCNMTIAGLVLVSSDDWLYLLILFRDAPVEVWAMTKSPIMLRSLALPFTVLEWTLPMAPRPVQNGPSRQSSSKDHTASDSPADTSSTKESVANSKASSSEGTAEDTSESFAFALVNGALGVFEVHGRRIRDFRPKWPSSSFVSSDGLVTAMAYRLPHVVMGDRSGNIRWWDVTSGVSSSFNTHREGIRRIKFSPVVAGDRSRGRIAVLFYDNTFAIYDLDSQDPLANSLLQPQLPGTLVLELDWLPLRTDKNEPLVLCIAGADSSFRLIEVNINDKRSGSVSLPRASKERFRPMPLCSPVLLPTPHALALRMVLQLGVKPSWLNRSSYQIPVAPSSAKDLRSYMIDSPLPPVGDTAVAEMLLKVLEPYQREGCLLDDDRTSLYAAVVNKGSAARFAFAAAVYGELSEAFFWLQLPRALSHLMNKSANKTPEKTTSAVPDAGDSSLLSQLSSKGKSMAKSLKKNSMGNAQLKLMAFDQDELWENANERISWHEKLDGEETIQNRVHELKATIGRCWQFLPVFLTDREVYILSPLRLVSVGNLEAAVTLLLSTPPEGSYFYANALRAVALSSAVSRSLHELAVKVVAANMVRTDKSLCSTHLLCAVGRYQEACSQLQDAGCWTDAATLAATHLKGNDYGRVLLRWADHVLRSEHNIWRALILYVAAGALQEALAALRDAQQADTAAMFLLACQEICAEILQKSDGLDDESIPLAGAEQSILLRLNLKKEDVEAVNEYFGQYQRKLVHLCMDLQPLFD
ncbi:hypothetical protein Syun_011134 [Stephania yunnanensis]|uniref:WD repeat-containing protein 11 n=1 Tax=Stephania yunnanensis TaxID=152371 RepID=A0AAP0JXP5_9MAGN